MRLGGCVPDTCDLCDRRDKCSRCILATSAALGIHSSKASREEALPTPLLPELWRRLSRLCTDRSDICTPPLCGSLHASSSPAICRAHTHAGLGSMIAITTVLSLGAQKSWGSPAEEGSTGMLARNRGSGRGPISALLTINFILKNNLRKTLPPRR